MTNRSKKRDAKSRNKSASTFEPNDSRTLSDGGVYVAFILLGVFAVGFALFVEIGIGWRGMLLGYLLAMSVLINFYTWCATAGKSLDPWQRSLARVPLRWVGYSRGKRRLSEADHDPRAKSMLFISIAISVMILLALTWWIVPR